MQFSNKLLIRIQIVRAYAVSFGASIVVQETTEKAENVDKIERMSLAPGD